MYRIKRITIKGEGSKDVNETIRCLSSFRRTLAEREKVKLSDITLTYEEREVCYG
jgi:hypothetical protein